MKTWGYVSSSLFHESVYNIKTLAHSLKSKHVQNRKGLLFFIINTLHYDFQYFWAFSLSIFFVESLVFRGGGGDSEADREPDINQQQLYSIRKHLYFNYLNVYFLETVDF